MYRTRCILLVARNSIDLLRSMSQKYFATAYVLVADQFLLILTNIDSVSPTRSQPDVNWLKVLETGKKEVPRFLQSSYST